MKQIRILLVLAALLTGAIGASAQGVNRDLAATSNFNTRLDGATANDGLGASVAVGDLNGGL